jgi:hypothetical protein
VLLAQPLATAIHAEKRPGAARGVCRRAGPTPVAFSNARPDACVAVGRASLPAELDRKSMGRVRAGPAQHAPASAAGSRQGAARGGAHRCERRPVPTSRLS